MIEKVWVQVEPVTGDFVTVPVFNAWHGFEKMGVWTERFTYPDFRDGKIEVRRETVVVGGILPVREAVARLGYKSPENMDYPECLRHYLGRNVRLGTLGEVRAMLVDDVMPTPVFIKPVDSHKEFTGHVISRFRDIIGTAPYPRDYSVWVSDVVRFVAEFRYFVHHHKVVGVGFYGGDPLRSANGNVVRQAVAEYRASGEAPCAYCIDFGVTAEGDTLLVEVNDGFAFGPYGLSPNIHANMLEDRWREMVGLPPRL